MVAIIQAFVALALLIGLPLVIAPSKNTEGMVAALLVAVVLFGGRLEGVARFVRNRRRPYPDSLMPPPTPGAASRLRQERTEVPRQVERWAGSPLAFTRSACIDFS